MAEVTASVPKERIVERHLRRSFRFGGEIAAVANAILRLKGEDARVGAGSTRRETAAGPDKTTSPLPTRPSRTKKSWARVPLMPPRRWWTVCVARRPRRRSVSPSTRTACLNSRASRAAARANDNNSPCWPRERVAFEVAARVVQFPGVRVGVIGGLEALKLNQLEDIWRLSTKMGEHLDAITDKYISTLPSAVRHRVEEILGPQRVVRVRRLDALRRVSTLQDDMEMLTRLW